MSEITELPVSFFETGTITEPVEIKTVSEPVVTENTIKEKEEATPVLELTEDFFKGESNIEVTETGEIKTVDKPVTESLDKDSVYKASIEYYKSIGRLPEDFELEDDVVLDDDSYTQILDYKDEYTYNLLKEEVRAEFKEKLGDNIIKFLENGGDYTKFAELAKEQSAILELNIATDSGQKAIVSKYYKEILGWKDEKIEKHIDRLYNDGELQEEATDLKEKFDDYFNQEQADLVARQEKQKQNELKMLEKQKSNFFKVLTDKGLSQKDTAEYVQFVFEDGYKLPDGSLITPLDYEILKIQRNPEELSELVQFLKDKEGYIKKKAIEINNPKVDKRFSTIIKNKTTLKGDSGSEPVKPQKVKFTLTTK